MDFSSQDIDSVKVSFIQQFTLPNFTEKLNTLNQKFSFLSNSNNYSQYYKNLESRGGDSTHTKLFLEIPQLGLLKPLKKGHTLNSYWQSFRLPLKIQEKEGKNDNELFLLLPLKINILNKSVNACGAKFPVRVYVYLFSFGSCCINMEIDIRKNYSLAELSELIACLKKSILSDGKSFERFSVSISNMLNRELFGEGKDAILFKTHTFIFVNDISVILDSDDRDNKLAIAAVMMEKTVADLSGLTEEVINQKIPCRLKKLRDGEILFFSPNCTFIYPSPIWVEKLRLESKKKLRKNLLCMCDNYRSLLNVTFAVNRFLSTSFIENKEKLLPNRSGEIVKCFTTAFTDVSSNSSIKFYFRHAFEPIAKQILLTEKLKNMR